MKSIHLMSLRACDSRRSNLPFNGNSLSRGINRLGGDCFVVVPLLLATTLFFSACLPLEVALPTEPAIPTDTPLPTTTILWFPATATPTPPFYPTYAPTEEMDPGIGAVTLRDNFSKASTWDTATSNDGSASIAENRLSLAVQPGIYLVSQRHDLVLSNFYAEVTANLSLCRGSDNYGVVVRSAGRSYYRFTLSCNGLVQAERVNTHGTVPLHDPIPSADVPRGAPGNVTIGVWAVDSEIRLFLNGHYQFGFSDTSFASGGLGVFALSQGTDPVSVTFSDLTIYEVDYALPTKTPRPPTQTPSPK